MLLAQGGKFHHGFLSGFVSSLGGSYMDKNRGDMTVIEKIAISAAIGGTAEALGGGKFANGAVTGAYVMAFNHLMHSEKWHPTREEAATAAKSRVEVTGNEASVLVYTDECGDEYFWENPPTSADTELSSKWTQPSGHNLKLVEEFHFSKEFSINGRRITVSYVDYLNAMADKIIITHVSLGFGKWEISPNFHFFDKGKFTPFHPNNYFIESNFSFIDIIKGGSR